MLERLKIYWYSRNLHLIPLSYDKYLSYYNLYYRLLNPLLQKKFRERVFISSQFINFKPIHFGYVTEEMKILITSALVQITFGLKKYVLRDFKNIYVIPFTYSYDKYDALVGHVNFDKKEIALSWPSVKNGYIIPDDALNVALHEISHALHHENHQRFIFQKFFDQMDFMKWESKGYKKLLDIRNKENKYLRDYGGNNMLELFAVCIESFFEQPNEFKNRSSELYQLMVKLLKQDPSNKSNPTDEMD